MKNICVYCGARYGEKSSYKQSAINLGHELASQGIGLIYGGGALGLMGAIADAVLSREGRVIGIRPEFISELEPFHEKVEELHVVDSMHERKAMMAERADGFIAMPGGLGTLDEIIEIMTWAQLGLHSKPIGLLNTDSYYKPFLALIEHGVAEGFINEGVMNNLIVREKPSELIQAMKAKA